MSSQPERVSVRASDSSLQIEAEGVCIGPDVLVYIWGGEKPHIGSVAAAQPRPSLADPSKLSATASVLTYARHKEDTVAKETAEALASALGMNVVVTAGIHWDDLPPDGIGSVVASCREITEKLAKDLARRRER